MSILVWLLALLAPLALAKRTRLMDGARSFRSPSTMLAALAESEVAADPRIRTVGDEAFLEHVRTAARAARERGMDYDLTLGSGWPSGGVGVPDDACEQQMSWTRVDVMGPASIDIAVPAASEPSWVTSPLVELFNSAGRTITGASDPAPELQAMVAAPLRDAGAEPPVVGTFVDLRERVENGRLRWEVPPGAHALFALYRSRTPHVVLSAAFPGVATAARVIDHLGAGGARWVIEHQLGLWLDTLAQDRPARLFLDSFELTGELPWSPGLARRYEERVGHAPELDMPFFFRAGGETKYTDVLTEGPMPALASEPAQWAARAREEYESTRAEAFAAEFLRPLLEAAHERGVGRSPDLVLQRAGTPSDRARHGARRPRACAVARPGERRRERTDARAHARRCDVLARVAGRARGPAASAARTCDWHARRGAAMTRLHWIASWVTGALLGTACAPEASSSREAGPLTGPPDAVNTLPERTPDAVPAPSPSAADASANGSAIPGAPAGGLTVTVQGGALQGALVGQTRTFLGIPFAKLPVGALRFAPPEPAPAWSGSRPALESGPDCAQSFALFADEDCLTLDVFTPSQPERPLAVMVFIHGGGYTQGGPARYDLRSLSEAGGVVVVSRSSFRSTRPSPSSEPWWTRCRAPGLSSPRAATRTRECSAAGAGPLTRARTRATWCLVNRSQSGATPQQTKRTATSGKHCTPTSYARDAAVAAQRLRQ